MASIEGVLDGKISAILNFGAFVQLQDGSTGLVHISEISAEYVKDVNDFLKVGQEVKVVALPSENDGKKRFSIKKANAVLFGETAPQQREKRPSGARTGNSSMPRPPKAPRGPRENAVQDFSQPPPLYDEIDPAAGGAFEDKLAKFMKESEERLVDLKRQTENQRGGGYIRRG